MLRVIGIGDNVCDKYQHLNTMYPGGQTFNFTIFSKILGCQSSFMGVFGNDACARHIIGICEEFNIDISHSRRVDGENAYSIVKLIEGDRTFAGSNRGGVLRLNPIRLTKEDIDYIKDFHIIYTSDKSYLDGQLKTLSTLGPIVAFDFSSFWKDDERTRYICKYIDFAFMSCSHLDENSIKDQMIATYSWGASIVVATRGSEGSLVYDGDNFYSTKPEPIKVVDSLGAGDSFAAGFLTYFVKYIWNEKDLSNEEYIRRINKCFYTANSMAAKTCLKMGAFGHGVEIL